MDRFRQLEVFERVVARRSFTKAADDLGLPRATVTEVLQALEARLGTTLLHRTTRQVGLTPEGAVFHERALRLLQEFADAEDAVGAERGQPRGRLRVDVPAAAGRHVIAPALPGFLARYPDIRLELGSSDRPVELVLEGVDCVVRGGDVHDEALVARPLVSYPVITVAAPSYLATHGVPEDPREISGHRFVHYFSSKTGRAFAHDFERGGERVELPGDGAVASNDADTQVALVVAGLGLAQLPLARPVRVLLANGALRRVLAGWAVEPLPLAALWPRRRDRSARLRAFVDWASTLYADEQAAADAALASLSAARTP
ncbi:MAG: LysR family transcriptional regulator [Silanimonas sp.]